jgi:molecular chaperone GrpE
MARKRRRRKTQTAKETEAESVVLEETETVAEEAEDTDEPEESTVEETEPEVEDGDTPEEEATKEEPVVDLNKELADMTEKYMRTRAEMENFRKRKIKEIDDTRRHAKISTIEEIMPVMDQFQMAVSAMDGASDLETIKMGMKMIQTTFDRAFENLGMDKVPSVGLEFDPLSHEAISMEPSEETPSDHVIREWKSGYKIGDFLIRPASVVVSSGDQAEDDEADSEDAVETDVEETTE